MSLLLDHGHQNAHRYPLWMVSEEAELVVKRLDVQMASQISLFQMALSSIQNMNVKPSTTNAAARRLNDILKGMLDGE